MPNVMLIEDDQTMLSLLQTLLEIEGFEVIRISSERDALRDIQSTRPDLVLLDVHLKGMDGMDLLRSIRGHNETRHTRVLMTSGMDFKETCLAEGADGFILKPYMPDELIQLVKRLTEL